MSIIRGPFIIKWGDNEVRQVEEVDFEYEIDADEYVAGSGNTFEIERSNHVSATLTILSTDIDTLSLLLPQHFVLQGGILSTGETVENAPGAMDIIPINCDEDYIYDHLDIISCGNPAQTVRIVNARTRLDGIEVDSKVRKFIIKFIGEPATDQASVQVFNQDTHQYLLVDSGELYMMDDGHLMIV